MSKQQIHEAKMSIPHKFTVPQYERQGVEFELRANGDLLGTVTDSGAHVYVDKGRTHKHWTFTDFVKRLKDGG